MPRPAKPPRLHLRRRGGRAPVWVILDRGVETSTECGLGEERGAEEALRAHLAAKHESTVGTHNPSRLRIADALDFYGDAKEPKASASPAERRAYDTTSIRIGHLIRFFGDRPISDIRGEACRDYVDWRAHAAPKDPKQAQRARAWPDRLSSAATDQTARRELTILRAAVNLYHKEYTLDMVPSVTLPELAESRREALSHSQAAALLAGALGFYRDDDGTPRRRARHVRTSRKRTARFMIIGFYSGGRHTSITTAKWIPSVDTPWIDVDRGILHRRGTGEADNKKRRPPARIPPRLLAHLRRWREMDLRKGIVDVLSRSGKPLAGQLRKGWAGARADAGLPADVTPHVMRHTAGTWLAQGGVPTRQAADYVGMSEATFERVYYSADPAYQSGIGPGFAASKAAAAAIRRHQNESETAHVSPMKLTASLGTKRDHPKSKA